jgi:1-acyl-sn-glycerol-3-phosphate acyltransferase
MIWPRSILFAVAFFVVGGLLVVVAGLATVVSPQGARWGACIWSRYCMWAARRIAGIHLRRVGSAPAGPVIIAFKHQSAFETVAVPSLFDWPAVVMKAELMRIPVWGWIARRHGSIPVERDGSASALRAMMRAAEAAIAEAREIVIFPEGTRVPVGEAPALKPGVSGLYRLLKLPVVPVALDSGRLWPRRGFLKRPGTITLRFGAPIPPGLPRADFEARLHAAINEVPAP